METPQFFNLLNHRINERIQQYLYIAYPLSSWLRIPDMTNSAHGLEAPWKRARTSSSSSGWRGNQWKDTSWNTADTWI